MGGVCYTWAVYAIHGRGVYVGYTPTWTTHIRGLYAVYTWATHLRGLYAVYATSSWSLEERMHMCIHMRMQERVLMRMHVRVHMRMHMLMHMLMHRYATSSRSLEARVLLSTTRY